MQKYKDLRYGFGNQSWKKTFAWHWKSAPEEIFPWIDPGNASLLWCHQIRPQGSRFGNKELHHEVDPWKWDRNIEANFFGIRIRIALAGIRRERIANSTDYGISTSF